MKLQKIIILPVLLITLNVFAQSNKRSSDFNRLQMNIEFEAAYTINKLEFNRGENLGFDKTGITFNYRTGYQNLITAGVMSKGYLTDQPLQGVSAPIYFTQILTSRFNSDGTRSSKIEGLALSAGVNYNFLNTTWGKGGENLTLNDNVQGIFRVGFFLDLGVEFYLSYNFDINKIKDDNGNEFSYDNIGFGLQFPIWSIVK